MLNISNLKVNIDKKNVLQNISLKIRLGEIHAVMGPNGSGKSTLANTIMSHPKFEVESGKMIFKGKNLHGLKADKRALLGLFLAFQYPKEIPGVSVSNFLRTASTSFNKARNKKNSDPIKFRKLLREKLEMLEMDSKFMNRSMNEGFSGGEKKKMEILQMLLLTPSLAILDEPDSGLDLDALRIVANGINEFAKSKKSVLLITHYQRILRYVKPNFVHVMIEGKIVASGGPELGKKLEKKGYGWLKK